MKKGMDSIERDGYFLEFNRTYGGLLTLPMVRSIWDLARKTYMTGYRVLDFGAGRGKGLRKHLGLDGEVTNRYHSVDIDLSESFTYRSLFDIPADMEFGLVVASQILEHMDAGTVACALKTLFEHTISGGDILIGVPNQTHPVRYDGDVTHVTNWPPHMLYAYMRHAGFDGVAVYRTNRRPQSRNPIKRAIVRWICEAFRIDWADTIIIHGRRL